MYVCIMCKNKFEKCALTALSKRLIPRHEKCFKTVIFDCVKKTKEDKELFLDMIKFQKVEGGSFDDSAFFWGVALKANPDVCYEQTKITNPKILLLNTPLSTNSEKENSEIREEDFRVLHGKLNELCNAKIVLSSSSIGMLATQYLYQKGIYSAGNIQEEDILHVIKSCGGSVVSSTFHVLEDNYGFAEEFEEIKENNETFLTFSGCAQNEGVTFFLRGGCENIFGNKETVLDAYLAVRRAMKSKSIVAGGGASEYQIARYLRHQSKDLPETGRLVFNCVGNSLEAIPKYICTNSGFEYSDIMKKLQEKHDEGGIWYGVDILNKNIADNFESGVWEPAVDKITTLTAAIEAVCLIFSLNE